MTEVTRGFCWHQNFVPLGCLPLTSSYIYLLNHEKMCIKQRLKRFFFFKLTTNDHSDKVSCWYQNFGPNGFAAPTLGLCLNFFSSITDDFNIPSALRWAIQDQWSSVFYLFMEGHKNCRVGTKKTGSVGLAETRYFLGLTVYLWET